MTEEEFAKLELDARVFYAVANYENGQHDCPDCNGTQKWIARSPNGTELAMNCPRCTGLVGLGQEADLTKKTWSADAVPLKVVSIKVTSAGSIPSFEQVDKLRGWNPKPEYLFGDEEAAKLCAELLAKANNEKEEREIETLKSNSKFLRHHSFPQIVSENLRSEIFNANYHASQICQEFRECLFFDGNPNSDYDLSDAKVSENLRELLSWNEPSYHLERLPFTAMFKALKEGDLETAHAEYLKIGEEMRDLLSGESIFDIVKRQREEKLKKDLEELRR